MKLKTALITTIIVTFLLRMGLAGILIVAAYELDTYALRLASICAGLWIGVMAIRKLIILRNTLAKMTKTE